MRTVAVVTVGRSDYGIYRPVLKRLLSEPAIVLRLIVSGAHLVPPAHTVDEIASDGFEIAERIDMLLSSDSAESISKAMGLGTIGFAQAYARLCPDLLVVLGDRFEMHSAALAALPFRIPVAHIHGGELTLGAFDDAMRHSITKLSHLHFVATEVYAQRIVRMGEEPWRVTISGAPSLDNLADMQLLTEAECAAEYGVRAGEFLVATFHPVTLEADRTEVLVSEWLAALDASGMPVIFTAPNADNGQQSVRRLVGDFVRRHDRSRLIENLGTRAYFSLMALAGAVVGNSSSGIIEAATFQVPVVNVGRRQAGRTHDRNVIDVADDRRAIADAIRVAVSAAFHNSLRGLVNPYDHGGAAQVIVERLCGVPLDAHLFTKVFFEPASATPSSVVVGG